MACYHPMLGHFVGYNSDTNKREFKIEGAWHPEYKDMYPGSVPIPCGKCIGCKLDYSRQWADRMILELDHTKKGVFLTLTYDNDHVPIGMYDESDFPLSYSLNKRDFQLFMKKLRKRFGNGLRFYAAGEYGSNTLRPHYHAIIFGLSLDDFGDKERVGKNELGQFYYKSDLMSNIWQNGFVCLSDVSWKTCAYVARYVTKKVNNDLENLYLVSNIEPEFSLMSRRPGIGAFFFEDHPDRVGLSNFSVGDQNGAKTVRIPNYLFKKLEIIIDEDEFQNLKEQREKAANDRVLLKLQKTNLSFIELMEREEDAKLAQIKGLSRPV